MKSSFRMITALLFVYMSAVHAQDSTPASSGMGDMGMGFFAGLNSTVYDADNVSFNRAFGFEGGFQAFIPLSGMLSFRTGAGLVQRNSSLDTNGSDIDVTFLFLELPATLYFEAGDSFGFFGGLNFDLKLSGDCSGGGTTSCSPKEPKTLAFNFVVGPRINLGGPHNIEIPLEIGMSEIFKETKISNSFAVRYAFEM